MPSKKPCSPRMRAAAAPPRGAAKAELKAAVKGGGAGAPKEGGEGEAGPPKPRRPPPPRKKPGGDEPEEKGQSGSFFVAMTGGTGFGLIKGQGELDPVLHRLDAPGFALAQTAQATPEVGFFVSHDLLLSAQLRLQYV